MKYLDTLTEFANYIFTQVKSQLSGKANTSHTHDERYYTETETDSKLNARLPHYTITTNTDFDTLTNTGVYHVAYSGCTNSPTTGHITLYVDYIVGSPYQIAKHDATDLYAWTRHRSSGSWTSWVKMTFTDNNTTYSEATTSAAGLMSATDKTKLDTVEENANYITKTSELTNDSGYLTSHQSLSGYLPLSGGTLTDTAYISWPDTGNWTNNPSDITYPVVRGGFKWVGQSDYVQIYTAETARDNLGLYFKFGDDNSNGLTILNSTNTTTARISASGAATFFGGVTATLTGNASSATKATQDSAGQQINTTYIKDLSVSGTTITYTKGDDTTGTITTQDTNTTYSAGTNVTISGTTISAKDTTYSAATTSANGLMTATDKTKLDGITYTTVSLGSVTLATSSIASQSTATVSGYPYRGTISNSNVTANDIAEVIPSQAANNLGTLSVECDTAAGVIYVYFSAMPSASVVFNNIILHKAI